MLFRKKKKEEVHKGDVFLAKGIYLKTPKMNNGHTLFNCFLRSIIVFLLTLGSIGGFLSAFSISYNYPLVLFFYMLLSMYFSFLYSTSKFLYRDIGYIAFFFIFVFSIVSLQIYANSGLYHIVNTVLRFAQTFFNLPGIREYDVQVQNDYLTVAIVAIFIGMVVIIVLNIWLYSSMSIGWTVLFTFPLLCIPLYMKLTPDPIYMICLGGGYIAVIVFKANGHYLTFAWDSAFRVKGFHKDKVTYTQDSKVFSQVLLTVFTIGFCLVILLESIFPPNTFESRFTSDRMREQSSDAIGNFLLLGFASFMNRYPSTGGISGGKLGGISNVRPDYQTDLVVSFAPYNTEGIYLKAYTGGFYGDNQWISIYEQKGDMLGVSDQLVFQEESLKKEANQLFSDLLTSSYGGYGKMDIKNVGADTSYLYYPYYTMLDDYSVFNNRNYFPSAQGIAIRDEVSYMYFPKVVWEESYGDIVPGDMNVAGVNSMYLDVPEKNQEIIRAECEKIGLRQDMTENEIVAKVQEYFVENIPYTLKPGSTPRDEDFVNYFLTKNRKGFCAHFASTATLIFRSMGIPARYVEGYAFSFENALASDENTAKTYEDYYQGYSTVGKSTVLDVEVTDSMAHAWVEIYIDGFGWKNVEVTPGSNEVVDENDFWSAFSDMLGSRTGEMRQGGNNFGTLNLEKFSWLIYTVVAIIVLLILLELIRFIVHIVSRILRCHQKDEKEALIAYYADLCDMLRLCGKEFKGCRSHREQLMYIHEHYLVVEELDQICGILEQISFSEREVLSNELQVVRAWVKMAHKMVWKKETIKHRMAMWRR